MDGSGRRGRVATLAIIAALLAAACGDIPKAASPATPDSPGASAAPSPAGPSAGASRGVPSGAPSGHDLAELSRPSDPRLALATLLGVQDAPLAPDMAALRDDVLRQLGDAPDRPISVPAISAAALRREATPSTGHLAAAGGDTVLVGFLLVEMAVLGRILPSKQSSDALAAMIGQVARQGGRDGSDSVAEQQLPRESVPFDATTDAGSQASGTLESHGTVKAERSLVSIELDRQLVLNFTAGASSSAESGTSTITIQNAGSVDFCPDVGGVVPLKLQTTFAMTTPSSTVTATVDGSFLALVDDAGNHVYTNGSARVTRLTASSTDVDVQLTNVSLDPSGSVTGGTWSGQAPSEQVAAEAAGAALFDLENAVPTILRSAEDAWQRGSCVIVDLPDFNADGGPMKDGSGQKDVDPGSKTEFTAQVHQRFEHSEVNLPIKVTLQTEKSIDPPRLPGTPAKLTYEAPDKPDAHNDVVLEVASKRGKSKLTMRFDTKQLKLLASVNGTEHLGQAGNVYDTTITLKPKELVLGDDGSFHGDATVSWRTTYTPPTADCQTKTYTGTFGTKITARPDPDDETRVFVKLTYEPGQLKNETIVCNGIPYPFTGGTLLAPWGLLSTERPIALDGSVDVRQSFPGGSAKLTVTIKRLTKP